MGVKSCVSGLVGRFGSNLVAAGGIALVLTLMLGAGYLDEAVACETDEPSSCSGIKDAAGDVLEERDGDYIMAKKSTDVKDFLPDEVFEYVACSGKTGTALMHWGTPVTNEYCYILGCNYKQCLQKRWNCDKDSQTKQDSTEPWIQCVAGKRRSNMETWHFVAFFFCFVLSSLMCLCGCMQPAQQQD